MLEKRLIDVDVAEKSIRTSASLLRASIGCGYDEGAADALISVADMLKTMPTVDAVEVVRCKDCKFYMTIHCICDGCCISDDWYCAGGERRTDAED